MNRDFSTIESPLAICVRSSGTLPISLQGHYDHWKKYHGRKDSVFEEGIKTHLKNLRIKRSFTDIKKRSHKTKKLPSMRYRLSKQTSSLKSGKQFDIFDMFNEMVESGSTWWPGSPLPEINKDGTDSTVSNEVQKEPFYILPNVEMRRITVDKIMRHMNDRDILEMFPPRTLHIYLASSNSDMVIERKHLEGTVWPYLRHLCLQYGRELIIHDLHTFSDELIMHGDNKYLSEIKRSLSLCLNQNSNNIKAVILFGDYFDKKGPPQSLMAEDMAAIKTKMQLDLSDIREMQDNIHELRLRQQQLKHIERRRKSSTDVFSDNKDFDLKAGINLNSENDRINIEIISLGQKIDLLTYKSNISLIDQWYLQSEDKTGIFILQAEEYIIKDIKSADVKTKKQGQIQWENIKDQLCCIISHYLKEIMFQQKSIFEYEINMLDGLIKDNKCILISRTFNNIPKENVVQAARSKLISKIDNANQFRFELTANSNDVQFTTDNWTHSSYLKHLSANLQNNLERNIIENIRKEEKEFEEKIYSLQNLCMMKHDLLFLFSEHEAQCKGLQSKCTSPDRLLKEIDDAVSNMEKIISTSDNPTILFAGPQLNGKTNAMSTFIKRYQSNGCSNDAMFLYRIIGSSYHSLTKAGLLRSICLQIIYQSGIDIIVPQEFMALKTILHQLSLMINFRVIICLDGLDLLTDIGTDFNDSFDWLPVHDQKFSFIISCSTDTLAYKSICGFLNSTKKEYIPINIEELYDETIRTVVNSYLGVSGNQYLAEEQREIIIKHCAVNRTIGFIESSVRLARHWTQNYSLPRLGPKFELNIHTFFGKLEDVYGEPIIRRLLGYITCFRDGCSLNELLDLMTFDEVVQKYLYTTIETNDLRFTFCLLRSVLDGFEDLLEYFLDQSGLWTLKWKHSLYWKAASDRYLMQKDKALSYHLVVTQYFMNDASDQETLSKMIEDDVKGPNYSNYLTKQELLYNDQFDECLNRFNLRKILQLPYHFIQSQNSKLVKLMCFFNFYWLQAVVTNFSCYKLIMDITHAFQMEPEDLEYRILVSSLELGKEILSKDPYQLISQLLGRITDIVQKDIDSVEPQKLPNLSILYKTLRRNKWLYSVVPSKSCMVTCDNSEFSTFGFHVGTITCMLLNETSTVLLSSTTTGVIYFWDTAKHKTTSILLGAGKTIFQMLLGNANQTLVTAMPDFIEVWDLETKVITCRIGMIYDLYTLTISTDRSVFSAFFHGTFWMSSWRLGTDNIIASLKLPINVTNSSNGEICVGDVCRDFVAIAAVKYDNKASLIDIRNGEINPKILQCKEEGSAITNVAMSSRYYILCNKGMSIKDFTLIIFYIDLFEYDSLKFVRRISGCRLDSTISLSINSVGSHAITVNVDRYSNISNVSFWNLETEEHKHFCEIPSVYQTVQCSDFARIFLANRKSNAIFRTNILTSKSKFREQKRQFVYEYQKNDVYVFVQFEDNSCIDVFNVWRNKITGRKVLSFHSIAEPGDVILPYKDKLIIFPKKCDYEKVNDPVQMIKLFDLTQGRIIKEYKCSPIHPSGTNEFVVLDNDILIGPSGDRSSVKMWNYSTGTQEKDLRPNFNRRNTGANVDRLMSSLDIFKLVIEKVLISGDQSVIVVGYSTYFLSVISVSEGCHKINLTLDCDILHLDTAALTFDGRYLVLNHFNSISSQPFLTIWNTETSIVENALPVSKNILSVAITKNSEFVGFIKEGVGGFIWNAGTKGRSEYYKLPRSDAVSFKEFPTNPKIEFIKNDQFIMVFTIKGFYFWNMIPHHFDPIGSFQSDYLIQSFTFCLNKSMIAYVLEGSNEMYTLRLNEINTNNTTTPKPAYLEYFEKDNPNYSDDEDEDL